MGQHVMVPRHPPAAVVHRQLLWVSPQLALRLNSKKGEEKQHLLLGYDTLKSGQLQHGLLHCCISCPLLPYMRQKQVQAWSFSGSLSSMLYPCNMLQHLYMSFVLVTSLACHLHDDMGASLHKP